jgi:hypothetical protein
MRAACALAIRKSVPLWIEPVSYDKAALVMSAEIIQHAFCIHPNLEELAVMATELGLHRYLLPRTTLGHCLWHHDPNLLSEGTSIGMGDIYRLGDAVMAATNIKARTMFSLCFKHLTSDLEHLRHLRCWRLLLHVRGFESYRVSLVLEAFQSPQHERCR